MPTAFHWNGLNTYNSGIHTTFYCHQLQGDCESQWTPWSSFFRMNYLPLNEWAEINFLSIYISTHCVLCSCKVSLKSIKWFRIWCTYNVCLDRLTYNEYSFYNFQHRTIPFVSLSTIIKIRKTSVHL